MFTTVFFIRLVTLYMIAFIFLIVNMVVIDYVGLYAIGSVKDILIGSNLTIPVIIITVSVNVMPLYFWRSLERIYFNPEFYQGPEIKPDFKAEYARFKHEGARAHAESLIEDKDKDNEGIHSNHGF